MRQMIATSIVVSLSLSIPMLACGSAPETEDATASSQALTIRPGPPPSLPPCGVLGGLACTTAPYCGANLVDTSGVCRSCSPLDLQAQVRDPQDIVVSFSLPQPLELNLQVTNLSDYADLHATTVLPGSNGQGSQLFAGLRPSATYQVGATVRNSSCTPATTNVTMPTETLEWDTGYFDEGGYGDGFGSLTLSSTGDWTFTAHAHDASFFSEDYALVISSNWTDARGYPYAHVAYGQVWGTEGGGSRDSDVTYSGNDLWLARNYAGIATGGATFSFKLGTDGWAIVADSLAALPIATGATLLGLFAGHAAANPGNCSMYTQNTDTTTTVGVQCK